MYKRLLTVLMLTASLAVGQVMEFDGVDQRVDAPGAVIAGLDDCTFSYWLKSTATDGRVLSIKRAAAADSLLRTGISAGGYLFFTLDDGSAVGSTYAGINDGVWHHIGATYDQSTIKLYVDGVLVDSDAQSGIDFASLADGNLRLGCNYGASASFYEDSLDDLRIYDSVATSNEIARLTLDTCEMYDPLIAYDTDTVADYAGSNDGTPQNDPTLVFGARDLAGNEAMEFDGVDQEITVAYDSSLDVEAADMTLSAWVKKAQDGQKQDIIFKGTRAAANSYYVVRLNANNTISFIVSSNTDSNYDEYDTASTLLVSDGWTHLAATRVKSTRTMQFYFNGIEDGQGMLTGGSSPTAAGSSGVILGNLDTGLNPFAGQIDDTRIYSSALSSNQVSDLYTYELTGGTSGSAPTNSMAAYYTFTPPPSDLHDYASTWDTSYGNTNLVMYARGDMTGVGNGNAVTSAWSDTKGHTLTPYNSPTIEAAR